MYHARLGLVPWLRCLASSLALPRSVAHVNCETKKTRQSLLRRAGPMDGWIELRSCSYSRKTQRFDLYECNTVCSCANPLAFVALQLCSFGREPGPFRSAQRCRGGLGLKESINLSHSSRLIAFQVPFEVPGCVCSVPLCPSFNVNRKRSTPPSPPSRAYRCRRLIKKHPGPPDRRILDLS
ncbi:hypothetical protein B0T22DRAFT_46460 [Podospora appendiculata]|uniref:Secreted protein n=1 Tax=Podospora appendiculata TaxID=314037 RepID=A0AAE1CGN0_9PEZI|nr:hypothetical protein B0T22DRAFT_46460 [Podospora appendiculata]